MQIWSNVWHVVDNVSNIQINYISFFLMLLLWLDYIRFMALNFIFNTIFEFWLIILMCDCIYKINKENGLTSIIQILLIFNKKYFGIFTFLKFCAVVNFYILMDLLLILLLMKSKNILKYIFWLIDFYHYRFILKLLLIFEFNISNIIPNPKNT